MSRTSNESSMLLRARASLRYRSRRSLDALRGRLLPLVFPPAKGHRWFGPTASVHSEWTAKFDPADDASQASDELCRLQNRSDNEPRRAVPTGIARELTHSESWALSREPELMVILARPAPSRLTTTCGSVAAP